MDLPSLSFPISYNSLLSFLQTNVPNADGFFTTETGLTIVESVPFVQADIDAINTYYNGLTQSGEVTKMTPTQKQIITNTILARIAFGQNLMAEYGAQNILAEYTTTQVSQIAQTLAPLQALILNGSLETAVVFMNSLTPSALITQPTISNFVAEIQTYLASESN